MLFSHSSNMMDDDLNLQKWHETPMSNHSNPNAIGKNLDLLPNSTRGTWGQEDRHKVITRWSNRVMIPSVSPWLSHNQLKDWKQSKNYELLVKTVYNIFLTFILVWWPMSFEQGIYLYFLVYRQCCQLQY